MAFNIREATVADAEMVADFSRVTFLETFAAGNSREDMDKFMNEQFTREKLIAEVGAPGNTFLLCFYNDQLAGYARLRDHSNRALGNEPAMEIARIYAAGEMIGKGVGKSLMQACCDYATAQKKTVIWLGVWEKNSRAIEFYKKWGFEKFGEHDFLLGNDVQRDWLMKKKLG
ncbi:MAG TPA: GNAT family N-acetyltransferase [Chitinophagaceae bacterium]